MSYAAEGDDYDDGDDIDMLNLDNDDKKPDNDGGDDADNEDDDGEGDDNHIFEKHHNKELFGDARKTRATSISLYEINGITNDRAIRISKLENSLLDKVDMTSTLKIVWKEYFTVPDIPFLIERRHPDGCIEKWHISEFEIFPRGYKPHYLLTKKEYSQLRKPYKWETM